MLRTSLVMAAAGVALAAQSPQQPTFRSRVETVAIYATVTDRNGHLVPGLAKEDFEVREDGRPVNITLFSNEPQPATVAIMLDMSQSIGTKVLRTRDSTQRFIDALLPGDRVRIGTFGVEIGMSPVLTGDKDALTRILHEELWPGGGTPLWNALFAAMTSLEGETGRRVVLSLTDGEDTTSLPGWPGTLDDVRRKAVDEDFMMYAIAMEGSGLERHIVDLSEATGGGHFEVKHDADLGETFAQVIDELRHQYLFGFVPKTLDQKQHALEVRVLRPGLKAKARRSYLATAGS
ncbi:MAG TPA: VWA domain-containing protein [Vicinamibacterales bacterium]|nr:VWA domain-containing protein [Vicinamibacterales bacterium]